MRRDTYIYSGKKVMGERKYEFVSLKCGAVVLKLSDTLPQWR